MSSNSSSPSPPVSSLKAPSLPDAPEVREEMEVDSKPSTSTVTANISIGSGLDMSAISALLAGGGLSYGQVAPVAPIIPTAIATVPAEPSTPSTSAAIPAMSATPLNVATLQSLIASVLTPDVANKSISKLFGGKGPTEPVKKSRLKVFANGYFMTFDKISSCQKKHFWRCEYKNTCKARMHTDILTDHISPPIPIADPMDTKFRIATFIHDHNHTPPTDEEIRLYGLDPTRVQHDFVYLVNNNADPNQRRKIRKQVAEQEAANRRLEAAAKEKEQQEQTQAAIASARAAIAQAGTGISQPCVSTAAAVSLLPQAATSSGVMNTPSPSLAVMLAQLPFLQGNIASMVTQEPQQVVSSHISPSLPLLSATATTSNPLSFAPAASSTVPLSLQSASPRVTASGAVKRRATPSEEDLARDPMFEPTFQIARKLRRLWQGEPLRYPKVTSTPTRHLEFYIARNDGSTEHMYVPLRIEQRDENMLKMALQEFCGEVCGGMLIYGVSPTISIMFNQPMIHNWENGQFFLLDTSNPTRWRIQFVDDRTA